MILVSVVALQHSTTTVFFVDIQSRHCAMNRFHRSLLYGRPGEDD
jgi:hypothetical protein